MKKSDTDRPTYWRWTWALLVCALAAQTLVLAAYFEPAYSGPDAPGYFFYARLLAHDATSVWHPSVPPEWLVVHFNDYGESGFRSRYPPGFPVLLAVMHRVGGPVAALALNLVLVVLSTLLFFFLARRWVREWLALVAAVALGTVPAILEQAYLGFAHVPVLFFLVLGLLLLDWWMERPRPVVGLLAGMCLGTMPAVRYGAVVLGVGPAMVLAHWATAHRSNLRRLRWPVLGALLPLTALALYQARAYGSPLATGYSTTGEAGAFGLGYASGNWLGYWRALTSNAAAVTVLGLLGISSMLTSREDRGHGLLLMGSFASALGLYLTYYWTIQDFRFLIPTIPLLILGGVKFLDRMSAQRTRVTAGATFLGIHLMVGIPDAASRLSRAGADLDRAEAAVSALEDVADPGSVVVGTFGLNMILAYDGRWRIADRALLRLGPPPPLPPSVPPPFDEAGRPQPSPLQPGRGAATRSKYAELTAVERRREVLADLLDWAGTRRVYWVNPGEGRNIAEVVEGDTVRLELVREVVLPHVPASAHGFGSPEPDGTAQFWTLPDTLEIYVIVPAN